jgi:hypothetical protein
LIVDRDEAYKVQSSQLTPDFVEQSLENKKRLNGLLDQLLEIEKRRRL